MKIARPQGSVSIPRQPRRGLDLYPWCLEVNRAIQQLIDRCFSISPSVGKKTVVLPTTKKPWEPTFYTEGTPETPVYKVRFNLGTANNVIATNWNTAHTLGMADGVWHFVVLTITSTSGKVSSCTISITATAPLSDEVSKDVPPTSIKIVLGAVGRTSGQMIEFDNFSLYAVEVFRESKSAPAVGAETFSRWWRWSKV